MRLFSYLLTLFKKSHPSATSFIKDPKHHGFRPSSVCFCDVLPVCTGNMLCFNYQTKEIGLMCYLSVAKPSEL